MIQPCFTDVNNVYASAHYVECAKLFLIVYKVPNHWPHLLRRAILKMFYQIICLSQVFLFSGEKLIFGVNLLAGNAIYWHMQKKYISVDSFTIKKYNKLSNKHSD